MLDEDGEKEEGQTAAINVQVTPSFKRRVDSAARAQGIRTSDWVRLTCHSGLERAGAVQIVGMIAGGPACDIQHLEGVFRESDMVGPGIYGLLVTGNSMKSTNGNSISDGDVVLLKTSAALEKQGQIAHVEIIQDEGTHKACLKKVYTEEKPGSVRLHSSNEKVKDVWVPADKVEIRGVLRGVLPKGS